jgi:hypothetical protein
MSDMLIPDGVVPIEAWRTWRVFNGQLRSINSSLPWPAREAMHARCHRHAYSYVQIPAKRFIPIEPQHKEDAPVASCRCGIYATATEEAARHIATTWCGEVLGRVALWGRVIEHQTGWRAEYAYPIELGLVAYRSSGEPLRAALEGAYGVPVSIWKPVGP